jgi:hypothetical protein
MAVEPKRGCGYRRQNGLYLVGGGLSAPCDRMPYPLERCRTCGGGIKFTRGPQWLQPDFFEPHRRAEECACRHGSMGGPCSACGHPHSIDYPCSAFRSKFGSGSECRDESACPVCRNRDDFGPHLLLWIGRKHYTPEAYLEEGRRLGVSRRLSALPKGLVLGETWVLLAHLDAVPPKVPDVCAKCGCGSALHKDRPEYIFKGDGDVTFAIADQKFQPCDEFQPPKPTPGIFCAFVPRAVELILKQSDATPERVEREAKRGVTVVAVPDDDRDHQGSVWDRDEEDSQPELPGVTPGGDSGAP